MNKNIGVNKKPKFTPRDINPSPDYIVPEEQTRKLYQELSDIDTEKLDLLNSLGEIYDKLDKLDDVLKSQLEKLKIELPSQDGNLKKHLERLSNDPNKSEITFDDITKAINILKAEAILSTGLNPDFMYAEYIDGMPPVPSEYLGYDPCQSETGELPDVEPPGPGEKPGEVGAGWMKHSEYIEFDQQEKEQNILKGLLW
ncbi:MAG: hypothetical protein WCY37_05405, partial [Candidatus Dojkabacteria bacterium]